MASVRTAQANGKRHALAARKGRLRHSLRSNQSACQRHTPDVTDFAQLIRCKTRELQGLRLTVARQIEAMTRGTVQHSALHRPLLGLPHSEVVMADILQHTEQVR